MKKHPKYKTGRILSDHKRLVILGAVLFLTGLLSIWMLTDYFCNHLEGKFGEDYKAASGVEDVSGEEKVTIDWKLVLVNLWNSLPENYEVPLMDIGGGFSIDKRCYQDLQNMLNDCGADGKESLICSAYRSYETQKALFESNMEKHIKAGCSETEALEVTRESIAMPGTSEHQLGLAVDIVDVSNQMLNESQEDTEVQKWLIKNSWKYGFILRYPVEKSEITGIIYEPWHYRYVGKENAEKIHEQGVCLEEYLQN